MLGCLAVVAAGELCRIDVFSFAPFLFCFVLFVCFSRGYAVPAQKKKARWQSVRLESCVHLQLLLRA